MINILLFVAEHCSRYYPASEIPEMLNSFVPMITNDVSPSTVCLASNNSGVCLDHLEHGSCHHVVPATHAYAPLSSDALQAVGSIQLFRY